VWPYFVRNNQAIQTTVLIPSRTRAARKSIPRHPVKQSHTNNHGFLNALPQARGAYIWLSVRAVGRLPHRRTPVRRTARPGVRFHTARTSGNAATEDRFADYDAKMFIYGIHAALDHGGHHGQERRSRSIEQFRPSATVSAPIEMEFARRARGDLYILEYGTFGPFQGNNDSGRRLVRVAYNAGHSHADRRTAVDHTRRRLGAMRVGMSSAGPVISTRIAAVRWTIRAKKAGAVLGRLTSRNQSFTLLEPGRTRKRDA